ncbi:hypothetical protein KR009_008059, partial [Drosophila setifemur]
WKMPHKSRKLSEIKSNIRNVLHNLQQLEDLSNAQGQDIDLEQAEDLQRSTTTLLDALDQVEADKVAGIQKQRKRRRRLVKQKIKLRKLKVKKSEKVAKPLPEIKTEPVARIQKQSEHISLRKLHDAASILQTFDLLEKLCESRGGDKAVLSQKLAPMRLVWRRVQQECESEATKETDKVSSLENQWEMVFFGRSSPSVEETKKTFLERRSIWDSYISHANKGSSIPRGWVLPPENPTELWTTYRSESS